MNASLRKEIRSILPVFLMTMAVTTVASLLFDGSDAASIVLFIYCACAALLAASCFGNEYLSHTMPLLLTQPTPRPRLWTDKMKVLAGALAVTWFVALLDIALFVRGEGRPGGLQEAAFGALGIDVIVFCSTPLFTLLFRNIVGAMGATVGLPWGLFMIIMGGDWFISRMLSRPEPFFAQSFADNPYLYIVPFGAVYSAATFWIGFKTFCGMQLTDAQNQDIRLPSILESTVGRAFLGMLPRYTSPTASLIRKELQLQRASFIFAGAMCVLMGMAVVVFAIYPSEITIGLLLTPLVITAIIVPLVVGGLTFSEERNLGLAGWQLTMPPSVFKQWLVKMLVAIGVCAILGVALPLAMVSVLKALFAAQQGPSLNFFSDGNTVRGWIFCYLLVFSLVLYATSISTNTFRAIIASLGIMAGMGSLCGLTNYFMERELVQRLIYPRLASHINGGSTIFLYFSMPALIAIICAAILTFGALTFVNFRRGELTARLRWTQLVTIGSLTVISAAIFITLMFATNQIF